MKWVTTQQLDLKPVRAGSAGIQPHCGAFHHSQALFAVAVGRNIVEFDALTGCKLSSVDIGAPVLRMAYSPAGGHIIVAVLEDWTIKSWDLDTEHTHVLYSPVDKKIDKAAGGSVEVHLALTPLRPWLFFGAHRRLSVNVVGTIEGVRAATKIKTDLKKPITELACHPRHPILYVAYAEGVVRAYNIQTFAVLYTLQIEATVKLLGAGAFAFHSTLEWVFVGDRCGTLLAWDVSVPSRPNMIGIVPTGTIPIVSMAWHSMLQLLISLTKEGTVQVWRPRVVSNPNRPQMRANFFEAAGVEALDVPSILTQGGGGVVYPVPRIVDLLLHPKLNLATVLFAPVATGSEESRRRSGNVSRESRKQLFAALQSARGSPGSVLKEKLAVLGSVGILPNHQMQLQEARAQTGGSQLTMSDLARKAFLYGNASEGQSRSGPILTLPLLTIADPGQPLRDIPVCQPFQQELKFFNSEHRIFNYPVRAFFMDGCNLTAYNLASGDYNIYKKLSPTALGGNERIASKMLYSSKQHVFLIFFECRGATSEVVLYRDNLGALTVNERVNTVTGSDGAFVGYNENQYAILDEDGVGLVLYFIEEDVNLMSSGGGTTSEHPETNGNHDTNGALDEKEFSEPAVPVSVTKPVENGGQRGPVQFAFDTPVQRIFSSPLEATLLYACSGSHIGLGRVFPNAYTVSGELTISTSPEVGRLVKLHPLESVLEVRWQETLSGQVAGILTTQRVMITSSNLEVLASSSAIYDKGYPPFRSLMWVGPSLLYSTATSVLVLGWDGIARPLVTIGTPNAALVGALNDRLLLACANDPNPRQKQGVEIKTRLVGLLEPLLVGWTTMQRVFEPKLDLLEIMYQLTSRFDSLRVTPRSLDALAIGPPVCAELAVELAQAGPQFTQELRCKYAVRARRFSTALSILKDEFLRSREYPRCPPTTHLFQRFQELGQACINYGQFDHAKETFEVVSDYQSMLDLFLCHLNPSALRRLVQKLEEAGASPELQRQCEKILSVRTANWSQGMFANFSAESMVPKGPEWGGGNWEIKTPSDAKKPQEWELSSEVTAYMKTANGPIPTITPDHIGVYLGTLRGRGTVVEVREDMLVRFGANAENGSASSAANVPKTPPTDGSFMLGKKDSSGVVTVGQATSEVVTESDLQARAAEEFKKGLSAANGDSSDEDETHPKSTKPKFQIRINAKPIASGVVDANALRAATRQFKLGDPMPTGRQSISGSGSQEILMAEPAVAVTAAPPPPPPMMLGLGVGVGAGPIPEDFWKETIPATGLAGPFQAATAFPQQPQLYPRQQLAGTEGATFPRVAGQPGSLPLSQEGYGLPGNGVPPTGAPQPQITSLAPGSAPSQISSQGLDPSLSLPDGGVPPQASTNARAPVVDLGSLKGIGVQTNGTGKGLLDLVGPRSTGPVKAGQVPRGAPASVCFKTGLIHIEQNQLKDAMSCLDEAFLAMAKDLSLGTDIKPQARICAQYKIAVLLLQEIVRLQRVEGQGSVSAREEMARLARHLSSLPLQAKHRIVCIRTAIKRNMDVQNYAFSKQMLDLLLSKAPANKQEDLRALIAVCVQRGLNDRTIDGEEDPSQFCAATLGRLPTIGHDSCDCCGAKFSALASAGCTICGMGTVRRSDAPTGGSISPFG